MRRDALVVGINKYPRLKDTSGKAKHLKTPAGDAEAIAQLLEKYGEFEVRRLHAVKEDNKPQGFVKLEELKKAITDLFCPQGTQIPETAVLFFAGHGLRKYLGNKTEGFLVTSDVNPKKELWGLSLRWLRQILHDSPIRQQIIWLDCCHSGELFSYAETNLEEFEKEKQQDRCFIVASRDFQVAYEQTTGKHGVLSGTLIKGLDPTLQPDKWVTNVSLVNFVNEALKEAPQHPICKNFGGEITLTGKQIVISSVCPYKGLAYFGFNDEDPKYFYGRENLTKQLLEKLNQSNFIAVLGASGSGKSSVVRAGLLHKLKLGEIIPGSDRWKIYEPFTPGEHPLQNLEQVIKIKADQLQALINAAVADRVVLVIDQFEEVFTVCRDDAERQRFFEYLLGGVKQLNNKLCLVLVMRADFQGKCAEQEYAGLAKKIDENLLRVMSMSKEQLKEAIIKPAQKVDLEIDRELVKQMIADVCSSPGDLPLMQYTLEELWKQRTLGRLTINDYTRLGGVKEALKKRANQIYESLPSEEQLVAKHIFLELTHLGEGTEDTRQQVRQEDLVSSKRSPELVERVVQRLAKEKLVVTGQEEFGGQRAAVVNIAHEALISNWDLLSNCLKDNREALLRKQDIENAAREWRDKGKINGYLLVGQRLKQAKKFQQEQTERLVLSNLAQDFIQKSIKYQLSKRLTLISLAFIIPLCLGFLIYKSIRVRQIWATFINAQKEGDSLAANIALEQLIDAGESLANKNLSNANLGEIYLDGANLSSTDLSNANLGNSQLTNVNFSNANLRDTNFGDANLLNANLSGANLSGANLSNANLSGANLSNANLSNAYLGDTVFNGANLNGTDLSSAKNLTLEQARFALNWQKAKYTKLISQNNNRKWKSLYVQAIKGWIKSNIYLEKGWAISISAKGQWSNGTYVRSDGSSYRPFYNADGFSSTSDSTDGLPVPTAKVGSLVGKIDNNKPFKVGSNYSFVVDKKGWLYLSINDTSDLNNNQGALNINIDIQY